MKETRTSMSLFIEQWLPVSSSPGSCSWYKKREGQTQETSLSLFHSLQSCLIQYICFLHFKSFSLSLSLSFRACEFVWCCCPPRSCKEIQQYLLWETPAKKKRRRRTRTGSEKRQGSVNQSLSFSPGFVCLSFSISHLLFSCLESGVSLLLQLDWTRHHLPPLFLINSSSQSVVDPPLDSLTKSPPASSPSWVISVSLHSCVCVSWSSLFNLSFASSVCHGG